MQLFVTEIEYAYSPSEEVKLECGDPRWASVLGGPHRH